MLGFDRVGLEIITYTREVISGLKTESHQQSNTTGITFLISAAKSNKAVKLQHVRGKKGNGNSLCSTHTVHLEKYHQEVGGVCHAR